VTPDDFGALGLPRPFDPYGSSFFAVLNAAAPDAVPDVLSGHHGPELPDVVEGTTVLAVTFADGVVVTGDRRATAGHLISKKDMRKVFPADRYSAVAVAGVAGPATELAKVFATELEHYEKVEGEPLSLEGKANKLAHMVRAHMPYALQGLVVVPLFAGVDPDRTDEPAGTIFEYDPAGGRYEATDYAATGSGGRDARGSLRRDHDPRMSEDDAVRLSLHGLFHAAEEDSATGGPDLVRRIYPLVAVIDRSGYRELDDESIRPHVDAIVDEESSRR
jgi:proteasome beta subunit